MDRIDWRNRRSQFSAAAYRWIDDAISGPLSRASNRELGGISQSLLIGEDEGTPLVAAAAVTDQEIREALQDAGEALKEAVEKLPPPYNAVIRKMYFESKPLADVARELKLSAQRVQYLHSRALRMLRRSVRALR